MLLTTLVLTVAEMRRLLEMYILTSHVYIVLLYDLEPYTGQPIEVHSSSDENYEVNKKF